MDPAAALIPAAPLGPNASFHECCCRLKASSRRCCCDGGDAGPPRPKLRLYDPKREDVVEEAMKNYQRPDGGWDKDLIQHWFHLIGARLVVKEFSALSLDNAARPRRRATALGIAFLESRCQIPRENRDKALAKALGYLKERMAGNKVETLLLEARATFKLRPMKN